LEWVWLGGRNSTAALHWRRRSNGGGGESRGGTAVAREEGVGHVLEQSTGEEGSSRLVGARVAAG
jgi:hypothetical protein